MRIPCPNCPTEYDVPDAAILGRSRTLQCTHCGHRWRIEAASPAPPQPAFMPAASAEAPPEPVTEQPEPAATEPVYAPESAAVPLPLIEPETHDDTLDDTFDPEPPRQFGQPLDETERAAFASAIAREEAHAPAEPDPSGSPAELPPLSDYNFRNVQKVSELSMFKDEDTDGFDALVTAARSRSLDTEPEPMPPGPIIQRNRKKLIVLLVILLVIAMILLEHRHIIQMMPGTAGFFHALGLN